MPIKEFYYDKILEGFEMNKEQFVDLCILLGCDYCDKIRGKIETIQILCKLTRLAVGLQGCTLLVFSSNSLVSKKLVK